MEWMEVAKLAGAVAVPLVAVADLFYGMMSARLKPFEEDMKALRGEVHAAKFMPWMSAWRAWKNGSRAVDGALRTN